MDMLPIVDPAPPAAHPSAGPAGAAGPVRGTYALVSLGCPKNLVDSERMLGLLRDDGWRLVAEPAGADLVVVNTCAFLEASRQESYGVVR
ncbi:MAG: 30S ribosomal protein S12 methylthiotransferase RimO, partial [Planctomycetaceae bacterium]